MLLKTTQSFGIFFYLPAGQRRASVRDRGDGGRCIYFCYWNHKLRLWSPNSTLGAKDFHKVFIPHFYPAATGNVLIIKVYVIRRPRTVMFLPRMPGRNDPFLSNPVARNCCATNRVLCTSFCTFIKEIHATEVNYLRTLDRYTKGGSSKKWRLEMREISPVDEVSAAGLSQTASAVISTG